MKKVAVLIPANNEEEIIAETLKAALNVVPKGDIYFVDDGSVDKTYEIAKRHITNVITKPNGGKASALNLGIKHFKLSEKYEYIFLMDADSRPKSDFLNYVLEDFKRDYKKEIICVSGRIRGKAIDWISKYRQWEYEIAFNIHKRAQALISSILVTPGCATVYRSSVFKDHTFPSGTMTEDMDFTFQMHRAGFSKMIFESRAVVYTDDPHTIKDFVKQLTRWYTGFWQVVRKHDIPWRGQMLDLEVALLATEGLYNGILVLLFIISLVGLSFIGGVYVLLIPLFLDLVLFFIPTLVWSSIVDRDPIRILYIPHFYLLRFISSIIFLKSFFSGYLSIEREYVWNTTRYLRKEVS